MVWGDWVMCVKDMGLLWCSLLQAECGEGCCDVWSIWDLEVNVWEDISGVACVGGDQVVEDV